jgi:ubiquinone/menaquinone biosynthesis C-methylase UbiE
MYCNATYRSLAAAITRHTNSIVLHTPSITDLSDVASNAVDRVLSLAGLHHMSTDQKQQFLAEAYRVLRPGGMIVVADVMDGYDMAKHLRQLVFAGG